MSNIEFGYDPTHERAYELAPDPAAAPPPTSQVDATYLPPVGQQGTASSPGTPPTCCAWASTELASFYAAQTGAADPSTEGWQASPAQIYIQVMQGSGNCTGSSFTSYFDILTKSGTPNLANAAYYANCTTLWTKYRNAPVAPDASFIIPQPKMIKTSNLNGMKAQIAAGNPLAWGTNLYTDWKAYQGPNLPVPYTGNGVLSGAKHCMLIIGYNATGFLIQNSQGTAWGTTEDGQSGNDNCYGYIWMAYATFSDLAEETAFYIPSSTA